MSNENGADRKPYSYGRPSSRPDIAMPPEGEMSPVERLTNPAAANASIQQVAPAEDVVFNNVPDTYVNESQDEVEESEQEEIEESVEEEVLPIKSAPKVDHSLASKQKSSGENFKELRLARERAEKKSEQQEALIAHLLSLQNQSKQAPTKQQDPEEDLLSISDDAFVEGKDYKRLAKSNKNQVDAVARKLAEYEQKIENMAAEARVRAKCPDLDNVVTDENIYLLRERYPEVAQSLNMSPDSWDKYASVYTMIKTLGIHKTKSYDADKARAVQNSQKPKAAASLSPQQGESPLTGANAFIQDYKMSKEGQAQAYKEMKDAMKKA